MPDATPVYRGYRRQILYTLDRLLEAEAEGKVFQLEGIEDLDVYGADGTLIEVVQVKDHAAPLTLSDLASKNGQEGSFVHRIVPLLQLSSNPTVSLASFGPIGPELSASFAGEEKERRGIVRKLKETYEFSEQDAERLAGALRPVDVQENTTRERVFGLLRNSVAGVDPESAFELLSSWLYRCAEQKCRLTRQEVIDRVLRVGRFVSRQSAHHAVWFTTVEAIADRALDSDAAKSLAEEFYRGVGTRYEHILAELDVPRPEKLDQLYAAFAERSAVVLHAASGQGKTTLAFRYLHDAVPENSRYLVRLVENRVHGQQIAAAVEGYADALEVPVTVFVDVSPNDDGWPELVERLARHPRIRVLVAVREEDWRRATFGDTDAIREVDLAFDRSEAEGIFKSLAEIQAPAAFLDFEEAWERFGSKGSLLEFVYLVTQGGLLHERLEGQVSRLKREANRGLRGGAELDLLRLTSVAAAFGGRLRIPAVASHLRLPAIDEAIRLLEQEYLVRRTTGGALLDGVHPIRSDILVDLLCDDDTAPWSAAAAIVLSLLDESDIGRFLLHSFSRRKEQANALLAELSTFHPATWVGTVGVLRSLLWLGLREYAEANRALIEDARRDSGPGWSIVLDGDIANAMAGVTQSVAEMFDRLGSEERRLQVETLRSRQTPKITAYDRAINWLRSRSQGPTVPSSDEEWTAAAEVAFWVRRLNIGWPLGEWLPDDQVEEALRRLPLDVAADVVVGLVDGLDAEVPGWFTTSRPLLIERFQRETLTPVLADDGEQLTAHFIVDYEKREGEAGDLAALPFIDARNPLHNEALVRVFLLRRLFPDRNSYACQGYGHRLHGFELPNDYTRRPGTARGRLPLRWLPSINSTFHGIVDFEARPADWAEYADRVLGMREEVARCLKDLHKALPIYLSSSRSVPILGRSIPSVEWFRRWAILRDPPLLPQCAVDEWGFVSESLTEPATDQAQVRGRTGLDSIPAVRRYRPLLEPLRAYSNAWHNFLYQAPSVMTANAQLRKNPKSGRRDVSGNPDEGRSGNDAARNLSVYQLAEAWKGLRNLQLSYRSLLGGLVNAQRLESLERRESELFAEVWPMWFAFAQQPNCVLRKPVSESMQLLDKVIQGLSKSLRRELGSTPLDAVRITVGSADVLWEDEPVLWLRVDGTDGIEVYSALIPALNAVRRAIQRVEDTPLRLHALDFQWRRVVVVPLIHSRSLSGSAWRVHTNLLLQAEEAEALGSWHFVPEQVPDVALSALGVSAWKEPRLLVGIDLAEATNQLWQLVSHVQDLANLPEVDGVGEQVGLRHIERMFEHVNHALQQMLDAASRLAGEISAFGPATSRVEAQLIIASEALQALFARAIPARESPTPGSLTLTVNDLEPWSAKLQEAAHFAQMAHLAWSSAVLAAGQDPG
jgi:hypothetical protein